MKRAATEQERGGHRTRSRVRLACTIAYVGMCFSTQVHAQDQKPPSAAKLQARVVRYCTSDFAKFCPDQPATGGRSMAICLKFYRSDLTFACRNAVKAAEH